MVSKLLLTGSRKACWTETSMCFSCGAEIENGVLAYLAGNSTAQDTMEGIVEWWLLEQKIKHGITEVREALDDLVAKELIVARETADKRVHYSINRSREKEIRALLERKE